MQAELKSIIDQQAELKSIIDQAARMEFMDAEILSAKIRRMLEGRRHTDSAVIAGREK
jgi:hypothetical protein